MLTIGFVVVVILLTVSYLVERSAFFSAKQRMENTMSFQTATLKSSMDKYAVLAALIARRSDITYALFADDPLKELPQVRRLTNFFTGISGAADVWIVNAEGTILVGNHFPPQSVDINNEKYFESAMSGAMGRASIVTHTGRRLYLFAAPVLSANNILGVIVVHVDLEYLEQVLVLLQDPMLVTDEAGTILLSSIKPWRLKSFYADPSVDKVDDMAEDYLIESFTSKSRERLKLYKALDESSGRDYLQVSQYDALLGWRVHAMTSYSSIIVQRNTAVLIALLIIALIFMAIGMLLSRQKRLLKAKRSQQAFALRLERQVRDRTHELTTSNQQLGIEIEEKRIAEWHLREAQEELVQAAKLAGIGQMSTALAHEYNQPLAAIRSYADNAVVFLLKEDLGTATDNLQRIKILVDKMASLTRTLRNFAYKTNSNSEKISIDSIMDELIILLSPQAKKQQVALNLMGAKEPIFVMGEQGRLSQVITNLVTNAMDAVTALDNRQVDICWYKEFDKAIIVVKDTGSGISGEVKEKMFNAFFTTKTVGNGLGLGLFIVMNIVKDLKGSLTLKEEAGYGAVFEIVLPLAKD
ncbi:MAG: two-component system C4-dicarboxylate transport sensor histidine kinase DctB [Cellvibrionaceae bacterium]|jgi:two-component system C4-dicarboxylate transport sensor histidine kinase DctB